MITIDTHQHFWEINRFDYNWMPEKSPLKSDRIPHNLKPLIDKANVNYTVTVQAHQSIEETKWLLELAKKYEFIAGVVGWVDLSDPKIGRILDELQKNNYFKGVRHLWHDEKNEKWILNSGVIEGLKELAERNLTFDFLARPKHIKYIPKVLEMVPNLKSVIDHIAKPEIANKKIEPWLSDLRKVANIDTVNIKLSGMVTEADHNNWNIDDIKPYVHHVLSMFGYDRIMIGSDWPVCTLAAQYNNVIETVRNLINNLDKDDQKKILGNTAIKFYDLEIPIR
ncbi:MAG: amidohydrolase [Chloroflexi bacterium]|nr:amidohydrolase [Chloroflexota bacterium]|tara:strand:- start:1805 stop:2647 length:843 start_codon:yes stop_codon:yes gene_type:complete